MSKQGFMSDSDSYESLSILFHQFKERQGTQKVGKERKFKKKTNEQKKPANLGGGLNSQISIFACNTHRKGCNQVGLSPNAHATTSQTIMKKMMKSQQYVTVRIVSMD